jgi:hypothetical protein
VDKPAPEQATASNNRESIIANSVENTYEVKNL